MQFVIFKGVTHHCNTLLIPTRS